jgi:hypothetical protein
MSIRFVFWRTAKELESRKIYVQLMARKQKVRELEALDLPAIDAALMAQFSDWTVDTRRTADTPQAMLTSPDNKGGLDIGYTQQSVAVTRYGMDEGGWDRVIDVMIAHRLPLCDPQINEQFA